MKNVQSSRLKKICENQEWCHVRNWGLLGHLGLGAWEAKVLIAIGLRHMKFLVGFSSDNNSTLKVPCTWGIYNVNMQTPGRNRNAFG